MRMPLLVGGAAALTMLLAPNGARAQILGTYTPTKTVTVEPAKPGKPEKRVEKFRRLQIGLAAAKWDFPSVSLGGGFALKANTDAGPLLTADYFVTKNISVGGWTNYYFGNIRATGPGVPGINVAKFHDNQFDFHAAYHLPGRWGRGWSVQGGYINRHVDIDLTGVGRAAFGIPNFAFTQDGANVWVNKTQQIARPRISGRRYPISIFGSGGYYFDKSFGRPWHFIGGGSIGLTDTWNFSGSFWLFDVGGRDISRISVGFTGSF